MSNAEFVVSDALRAHGMQVFLPTWSATVRWSDRKKVTVRPLFPGYLFVRSDPSAIGEVIRTAGVISLLPTNADPVAIPNQQLEDVRRIMSADLPMAPCAYVTGDEVLIDRGPLAGVKGIVQRTKNGTEVIVRIEMLQRAVSVQIPSEDLLKAS